MEYMSVTLLKTSWKFNGLFGGPYQNVSDSKSLHKNVTDYELFKNIKKNFSRENSSISLDDCE